jgi:peptidoglycan/LPS O-acetylase OafA/YrhL
MGILRLFLAVSVLATHLRNGRGIFGASFLNGGLAVECFFIISGFYMALVLNEKYNYRGSYGTFILQRILRLYPLYYVILFLILGLEALAWYASSHPFGVYETWNEQPRCVMLSSFCFYVLSNLTILGLDWLWFVQEDGFTGHLYFTPHALPGTNQGIDYIVNGPAWTLGIEMTFYLFAPFLVRRSLKFQGAWMLASLLLRSAFYWSMSAKDSNTWTYSFFPSTLFFFLAGSIGYQLYQRHRAEFEKFARSYTWLFWLIGVVMLVQGRLPFKEYFFWVFAPISIALVPLLFALTRHNVTDRFIGELSYPFYLVHFHVVKAVEATLHENYNAIFGPTCLLITLAISYMLYKVVELRTELFRERLFHKFHPDPKLKTEMFPAEFIQQAEPESPERR